MTPLQLEKSSEIQEAEMTGSEQSDIRASYPLSTIDHVLAVGDALSELALLSVEWDHPTLKWWRRTKRLITETGEVGGKPRNEHDVRPVRDDPQG